LEACKIDVGTNFWWGRWKMIMAGLDITMFFIGNHEYDKYEFVKISAEFGSNFYPSSLIYEYYISEGDLRIVNINNVIYIHASNLRFILNITKIENNTIFLDHYSNLSITGQINKLYL
jgi:hypothetical protein